MSTWKGMKVKHSDGRIGVIEADWEGFLHRGLKISLAIQGSRASGAIRSMASLVSRIGTELPKLLEAERQAYEASLYEET